MRILVTGATGFVGAALVTGLSARGHAVLAAARRPHAVPRLDRVTAIPLPDLAAAQGLEEAFAPLLADVAAVVHAAGLAHQPHGMAEATLQSVNADAAARLARAARHRGVDRFVLVSSVRAVSGPSSTGPVAASRDQGPTDAYGRSKRAAEIAVLGEFPQATILRPPVLHGAGAKGNMARLARLARIPVPLPLGGMAGRRSILSDANMAEAMAFVLMRPDTAGSTFHLSDGAPLTVAQMIRIMRQAAGRAPGIVGLPATLTERLMAGLAPALAAQLCRDLVVDDAPLRALGWRPAEGSVEGLGRMVRGGGQTRL